MKPSEKDSLSTRLLSCFCKSCVEESGECENAHHVDKWEFVKIQKRRNAKISEPTRSQEDKIQIRKEMSAKYSHQSGTTRF